MNVDVQHLMNQIVYKRYKMKKDKLIFIDTNRERVKYKELEELLNLIGMYVYEGNEESENLEELDFSSIQEIEDIYNKYELFQAYISLKCIANSGVEELYFKASKDLERLGTYESRYATLYCKTKAKGKFNSFKNMKNSIKIFQFFQLLIDNCILLC